jgi:hypothetical protein
VDTSHHRVGYQNPTLADPVYSEKAALLGGILFVSVYDGGLDCAIAERRAASLGRPAARLGSWARTRDPSGLSLVVGQAGRRLQGILGCVEREIPRTILHLRMHRVERDRNVLFTGAEKPTHADDEGSDLAAIIVLVRSNPERS